MTTGEPIIDYEALTQNAMRSVVHAVLERTANSGLPGDHHFYISFETNADGVSVSKRLKAKYVNEMTIVLQHRFWDLNVYDDHFEVKLTFDGIPERLVVPYKAIKVFFDPSVRYGLQFEEPDFNSDAIDRTMSPIEMSELMKSTRDRSDFTPFPLHDQRPPHNTRANSTNRSADNALDDDTPPVDDEHLPETKTPAKPRKTGKIDNASEPAATNDEAAKDEPQTADAKADNTAGAEIVSLDAFRKK